VLGSVFRSLLLTTAICAAVAYVLRENTVLFGPGTPQEAQAANRDGSRPPRPGAKEIERPDRSQDRLGDREFVIPADRSGHFVLNALINGAVVAFMVDTGATAVALSRADAERIGLVDARLDFSQTVQTANGVARVAPVTLDSVTIGQMNMRDVKAVVIDQPMSMSLLGMSFLGRLNGYEVRDRRLVMRW
jgi:aspartyl protease family protein